MKNIDTTEQWEPLDINNSAAIQEKLASTAVTTDLLEDPLQPITLAHKIVACSATILLFLAAIVTLRILSKSPLLPANRHFLFSLNISELLQVNIDINLKDIKGFIANDCVYS